MDFAQLLEDDAGQILQCPECENPNLSPVSAKVLGCPACGAQYPVDAENAVGALLSTGSDSAVKDDIKKWWGDLYQQRYAGHEEGLTPDHFDVQLDELEDMFRRRHHLATTEMPLSELDGIRVLEVGCGAGAHSALFARYGASVVAVDITPERVMATARKLALCRSGKSRAYQADAERLPFRDNSFDCVYSNGVLHHSEDTRRCIQEVHRTLKPGGRAVIMLYSRHSAVFWLNIVPRALLSGEIFRRPEAHWIGRVTEGKPKFGETRNPITRVYSARQIRNLFEGFKMVSLRKSSFQFDNFCVPRLTQIRNALLKALGQKDHAGGILVYGAPFVPEIRLELWLGHHIGFSWNIVVEK